MQAQQESSLVLSQSSTSLRGSRTRPKAGFLFNVQKWPVAKSSGGSVAKGCLVQTLRQRVIRGAERPLMEVHLPVSLALKRRGVAVMFLMFFRLQLHQHHLHLLHRLVHFTTFYQWRSITSNRYVLNMVKGHHLHLGAQPPLFHNFH